MRFIQPFQLYDFLDTLVSLLTAFVFGTLIGAERQYLPRGIEKSRWRTGGLLA
jgi:putative Mg2+ transporter-C (MgtC) family protein